MKRILGIGLGLHGFDQYNEIDTSKEEPVLLWRSEGWLPSEVLTRELQRYYFLLLALDEKRDDWKIQSDFGHTFECQWVNVNAIPDLEWEQSDWLSYLNQIDLDEI